MILELNKYLIVGSVSFLMMSPIWYLMIHDRIRETNGNFKCFFRHDKLKLNFALLPYYAKSNCVRCGGEVVRHYPSSEYLDKLEIGE